MDPTPVVYLFVPIGFSYGREIIRGVREYTQKNRLWQLAVAEPVAKELKVLKREKPDGVIGLLTSEELELAVRASRIPAVNVSTWGKGNRMPGVIPENAAIVKLATEHFLARGFRNFAFAGFDEYYYSQARYRVLKESLKESALGCHYIKAGTDLRLLRSLDTPLAVIACSDERARQVISAAVRLKLRVPEDVAVTGVDNDEALCELAEVPISSVDPNARRIGFEAASMLDALMSGRRVERKLVQIPPAGLIVRSSSDVLAVPDEQVANAMRYMQVHACDPMRVEDMMASLGVSRRTLEKRFRSLIGHTLHDEIRRLQFERARQLLSETDMKIPQIASKCGFRDPKRFTTLFRVEFGAPPVAFRRDARAEQHV